MAGAQGDARLYARFPNHIDTAVHISGAFHLYGYDIGSRFDELMDIPLRLNNHEMHVEHCLAARAQGTDYAWTEGYIGYEHAVHYIDVQILRARCDDHIRIPLQMREIR